MHQVAARSSEIHLERETYWISDGNDTTIRAFAQVVMANTSIPDYNLSWETGNDSTFVSLIDPESDFALLKTTLRSAPQTFRFGGVSFRSLWPWPDARNEDLFLSIGIEPLPASPREEAELLRFFAEAPIICQMDGAESLMSPAYYSASKSTLTCMFDLRGSRGGDEFTFSLRLQSGYAGLDYTLYSRASATMPRTSGNSLPMPQESREYNFT